MEACTNLFYLVLLTKLCSSFQFGVDVIIISTGQSKRLSAGQFMKDIRSESDRRVLVALPRVGCSVIGVDRIEDSVLPEDVSLERRLPSNRVVDDF